MDSIIKTESRVLILLRKNGTAYIINVSYVIKDGVKNRRLWKEVSIMWFWWFLLICDSLIPITMIIGGRLMWKHCPKQINGMVGYRTSMSMKNMDTWKFAHEYVGKLWWKIGWILIIPTLLAHISFYGSDDNTLGFLSIIIVVVQLVFLCGSILPTEKALKSTFNEDGMRR